MNLTIQFYQELLDNLYDGVYFVDKDRTILFWSKSAERLTGYGSKEIVGSHCWNNILMHVDSQGSSLCIKGCPLQKTMTDGVMVEGEVFLHHKEGHRVPVLIRATPMYDRHGSIIGAVEIFRENSENISAIEKIEDLQKQAFVDSLTGLANRRFMEMNLQSRFDELSRYGWQFGLLMIDIDNFKSVNDRFGHVVGDAALRMASRTMKESTRSSDLVSRWGGEEFIVLITNATIERVQKAAERYRMLVEQSLLPVGDESLQLTISIGATLALPGDTMETAIKRADDLMYQSKCAGRNRVTISPADNTKVQSK
ncbi:MAG: sensor domain-containing diguanylate cyclase [Geobacteraceae bacterium]